jgi:hypothetical protein
MSTGRALLLIADIGGYTRFMKLHRMNLAHAQESVARLLEAVIDGAPKPLKLSKLEGDAALFYAPLDGQVQDGALARFAAHVLSIRRAFLRRRAEMNLDRVCTCEGCTLVSDLTLKFAIHEGEVGLQRVKRMTELAGWT